MVKKKTKKIHPVKSRKAGISPKAKLFNRVKKKKKALKPIKTRRVKIKKKVIKPKKVDRPKTRKPSFSDITFHKTRIRIIGIGGGGSSIVSEIALRIKKVDFVVANTDSRALRESAKIAKRFQFGQDLTHGLGTGMNVELGEMAAQNEKEKIKKLLEGQDLCIIVVCLGGGTGSGATPTFAKISRSLGCLTYGIFTLPFEFEGEKKMEIAKEALLKIKPRLNAFSIIPNERIFQIIDKDTPLKDALSAINKKLAENLEGLIKMIYLPGLINIDFADLKTIFQGRGRLTYLNTIEVEGAKGEEAAIKKVVSSPLYPYTIKGARGILYNITGGSNIQLSGVSQISKIISELVNKRAKIIFGINQNSKYQNKIKITLLATGCGIRGFLAKPSKAQKPSASSAKKSKKKISRPKIKKKTKEIKEQKPKKKKKVKVIKKQRRKTKSKLKSKSKKDLSEKEIKVKVRVRKEEAKPIQPKEIQSPANTPSLDTSVKEKDETKVRRNALQVKKAVEKEEKELLEQEKFWETPAILRRKKNDINKI